MPTTPSRSTCLAPVACGAVLAATSFGCPPSAKHSADHDTPGPVDLVVVAPHPDDETLIAGGVLASAVAAGKRVAVVIVTNGDFTCARNGFVREGEAVAAMGVLGVPESAITFLGYPDGWVGELGAVPTPPIPHRDAAGACVKSNVTYGNRGAARADEHTARTGKPAEYTDASLLGDMVAVLGRLSPRDVYVTHAIDSHPDHAATYAYVRRALETLPESTRAGITLHRAVVHAGPCWPNGVQMVEPCPAEPFAPGAPLPPLPAPRDVYVPRERIATPASMRALSPMENTKMRAIAAYPSQTGPDPVHDWLASFVRADEPFYPEKLDGPRGPLTKAMTAGRYALRLTDAGSLVLEAGAATGTTPNASEPPRKLRSWLQAPSASGAAPPAYALRITPKPEDGPVVEVEVFRDGALVGVAVDAVP